MSRHRVRSFVALVLMLPMLAACPRHDIDHSTAAATFDTAVVPPTMAPGPAPEDLGKERSFALRASRSRAREADAAAAAEARRILEAAQRRALEQQRIAAAKLAAERPQAPAVMDGAFWRRLANCENADGDGDGNGGGYFQFSPDTAKKVGYRPGMSYETQVALAEKWLGMIGGPRNGGGRSGWPHCWWVALRG